MIKITGKQIALVTLVAFLWAICFPLIEMGHHASPPLRFAGIRSLIAGVSILGPLLIFNRRGLLNSTLWKYSVLVAISYTVLGFGGMFLADGRVSPGIATVLFNTQPLIAAVLAFFFLSERMSSINVFGLSVSFMGIVLIAYESLFSLSIAESLSGISFILMGAFGTAAGNVFMKKSAKQCDPLALTGLQLVVGSIILLILSTILEGDTRINWHPSFFWSLIVLAVPGTSVVTVLWLFLLKKVELSVLNVFTFLTPAFALLIGYVFFNERYSLLIFTGVMLTLVGIYLATSKTKIKRELQI